MTADEMKQLKVNNRVIWSGTPEAPEIIGGCVVDAGYNAVKIKWDDGATGIFSFNLAVCEHIHQEK